MRAIDAVVVAIPVNNEEERLPRCLSALQAALDCVATLSDPPRVQVVITLDACTDRSLAIAADSGFDVVVSDERNVGAARRLAVSHGLSSIAGSPLDRVWIANTDADSFVPENWIVRQLHSAAAGFSLMLGTVRPDPADLSAEGYLRWQARYDPQSALGAVHGTNLGVRADAYSAVGGFSSVTEHEDALLVERLRLIPDVRVDSTDDCWVLTSGRTRGRTPGGYAGHLAALVKD